MKTLKYLFTILSFSVFLIACETQEVSEELAEAGIEDVQATGNTVDEPEGPE